MQHFHGEAQVRSVGRGDPVIGLAAPGAGAATGAGGGADSHRKGRGEAAEIGGRKVKNENFRSF